MTRREEEQKGEVREGEAVQATVTRHWQPT